MVMTKIGASAETYGEDGEFLPPAVQDLSAEDQADAAAREAVWAAGQSTRIMDAIKVYRDERSVILVGYTSTELGLLTVMNDERTRGALIQKVLANLNKDDPSLRVKFKLKNMGYAMLAVADLQGLLDACDEVQQKFFDAEMAVRVAHAKTPFTSFEAAKAVFDANVT